MNQAVESLSALAQENRLAAFRLLVGAGPGGMNAGSIAAALDLPPATLSFHLRSLAHAGLVSARADGRFQIYTARFDTMTALIAFLSDHCCGGHPERCGMPAASPGAAPDLEP